MTTSTSETTLPGVGGRVQTRDQITLFPLGTVLRDEGNYHVKTGHDTWEVRSGELTGQLVTTRRCDAFSPDRVEYTVHSLPRVTTTGPHVGDACPREQAYYDALPVGTTVDVQGLGVCEKTSDCWRYLSVNVDTYMATYGGVTIRSLPHPAVTVGSLLETPAAVVGLSVGATFTTDSRSGGVVWEVQGSDRFRSQQTGNVRGVDRLTGYPYRVLTLPTVAQPGDRQVFTAGQALITGDGNRNVIGGPRAQQYLDMLPGTRVHVPSIGDFTKAEDGTWSRDRDGEVPRREMSWYEGCTVLSVPDPEWPAHLVVGYGLQTVEDFDACPVGTTIQYHNVPSMNYTKEEGGWREHDSQYVTATLLGHFSMNGMNVITSLPEPSGLVTRRPEPVTPTGPVVEVFDREAETLNQYLQRFRITTYGAAWRNSVPRAPLDRAFRSLNIPTMPDSIGMLLHHSIPEWSEQHGDVIQIGRPSDPGFSVKHYDRGRGWVTMLGAHGWGAGDDDGHRIYRLIYREGLTRQPWVDEVPGENTGAEIAAFKRRAWAAGNEAKAHASWCSEYERAMERMGINETTATDTTGLHRTMDQIAALPVGTVVRWTGSPAVNFYRRADNSRNPMGTVPLNPAHDSCSYASTGGDVLYTPGVDSEMSFRLRSLIEFEAMPPGTVISRVGVRYVKCRDGEWVAGTTPSEVRERGDYDNAIMFGSPCTVVALP